MDDHELVRRFVQSHSEDAFRELVDRHLAMVYSTARRMVRDVQLAEDIAQGVFTLLAQKAPSLGPPQVAGGWLYNTTRNLAMHALRTEQRRRQCEQAALAMQPLQTGNETGQILEQLEPAMAELETEDRDVVVMRYLESRSLRELGSELGISEDAARMRVNRALERLRGVMAQQGITVTSVLLASALASTTSVAVPAGLTAAITATAVAGAAAASATTQAVLTTMTWLNAKTAAVILGAAVIAGTGTYLVEQRQISRLRADNQHLAAQQGKLGAEQMAIADATQAAKDELERSRRDATELLRLRNEVTLLRRERQADKQRPEPTGAALPLADPLYQGKPLSEWLATLDDRGPDPAGNPQAGDPTEAGKRSIEAVQNLGTNAIPYLLSLMRGDNPQLRGKVALSFRILGETGAPAVPALRQLLQDNSPDVRREAAGALGFIGPLAQASTPDLLVALGDEDSLVRCSATYALGQMPNDPDLVIPALVARLADDFLVTRQNAATALGTFGVQARVAIPDLLKCLSDPQVRGSAIGALHRIDASVEPQVAPQTK